MAKPPSPEPDADDQAPRSPWRPFPAAATARHRSRKC